MDSFLFVPFLLKNAAIILESSILSKNLHPKVQSLKPSATLRINERSAKLLAEGRTIYRLGFGQSPFPVPPVVVQSLQDNAHQKDYLPVKGLRSLREAVALYTSKYTKQSVSAEQVLIGPGSKELIFNLQMAFDGDLILPSPSWVSYEPQAHLLGKKTHWIPTYEQDNWLLAPEQLDQACAQIDNPAKLLILNYPNNPTGTTYSAKQLKALVQVLRKNKVLVIADEIYGEVHHGQGHTSLSSFYPEGTVISSGLSKWCGAGGWRLGTFVLPRSYSWLADAMAAIASETFSAVSAPIQYAAITAFQMDTPIQHYLATSRAILSVIGNYVYQNLSALQIKTAPPMGGFYLFPNFEHYRFHLQQKGIETSPDLCADLLESAGIALLPGTAFGRPPRELTARLAFVDFDGTQALEYYQTHIPTQTFISDYCPKIEQAMLALQKWVNALT